MEIQGTEEQIDIVIIMIEQGIYINIERIDAKSIPLRDEEEGIIKSLKNMYSITEDTANNSID